MERKEERNDEERLRFLRIHRTTMCLHGDKKDFARKMKVLGLKHGEEGA